MTDAICILSCEIRDQAVAHDLVHEADRHGWAMAAVGFAAGVMCMVMMVMAWRYL